MSIDPTSMTAVARASSLDEAARACAASGLGPVECGPILVRQFPDATAIEMAFAMVGAWSSTITPDVTSDELRACTFANGQRAYSDEEVTLAVDTVIISVASAERDRAQRTIVVRWTTAFAADVSVTITQTDAYGTLISQETNDDVGAEGSWSVAAAKEWAETSPNSAQGLVTVEVDGRGTVRRETNTV